MKNLRSIGFGATAATALILGAGMASSENVVTVNTVQIFGTVDPAKINDYTEYMAGVNLYEALTSWTVLELFNRFWPKAGLLQRMA